MFDVIKNLYCNPKSDWILQIDDKQISPLILQKFLVLDVKLKQILRTVDKFVFKLPVKMYISSLWSLMYFDGNKLSKPPFLKYVKKDDKRNMYWYITDKVQRQYKLSDRDINLNIKFIEQAIEKDKYDWFSYYAVPKIHWSTHNLDFDMIKKYGDREIVKKKTLFDF